MLKHWIKATLFLVMATVSFTLMIGCGDDGDDSNSVTDLGSLIGAQDMATGSASGSTPQDPADGGASATPGEAAASGQSTVGNGGEENADGAAQGTTLTPAASAPPREGCSRSGFTSVRSRAQASDGNISFTGISAEAAPYDVLLVQSFADYNGPTTPGTYDLAGINFKDCGLCLRILSQCNDEGCQKTFYAQQGSVEITSIGMEGSQFTARFSNVVFEEVTVADDLISTPVPNGETWCMDDFAFDEPISGATSSGGGGAGGDVVQCPAGQTCVGDTVNNFSLTQCDSGNQVGIQEYFAGSTMGWIILTAGWCPACAQRIPDVVNLETMYAESGMKVMVIVGEGPTQNSPVDVNYCQRYAGRFQNNAGRFFVDNQYESTFSNLFPYIGSDGIFSLPWEAILDPQTMVYKYADRSGADIQAVANELLTP